MIKTVSLAAGLAGALCLSQFPAFTQSYLQRLAGQVDALTVVAQDFDRSALASGLGREDALIQMQGSAFLQARQADMRRTFARHARLSDHLTALRTASPLERLALPHRVSDPETLRATWADFTPSMPLSLAGLAAAGIGFLAGATLMAALVTLLRGLIPQRKPQTAPAAARREPVLRRPATTTPLPLTGETRWPKP